jgi:hypothetical protein
MAWRYITLACNDDEGRTGRNGMERNGTGCDGYGHPTVLPVDEDENGMRMKMKIRIKMKVD